MFDYSQFPTRHSEPELVDVFLPPRRWFFDQDTAYLYIGDEFFYRCGIPKHQDEMEDIQKDIDIRISTKRHDYAHLLPPPLTWEPSSLWECNAIGAEGSFFLIRKFHEPDPTFGDGVKYQGEWESIGWHGPPRDTIDEAKADCYAAIVQHIADIMGL